MGTRPLRKPGSTISPRTLAARRSYAFLTASAGISTVSWTSFSTVGSTFVFTMGSPSLRLAASGASRAGIRSVVRAGVRPRPVVRVRGLEPPRAKAHQILSLARLPVPPHPHGVNVEGRRSRRPVHRVDGVKDGIRTRDRRDHNPELCQLSYLHHRSPLTEGAVDVKGYHERGRASHGGSRLAFGGRLRLAGRLGRLRLLCRPALRLLVHGFLSGSVGAPGRIRTCDLKIRSLLLYPAELRARVGDLQAFHTACCCPPSESMRMSCESCREAAAACLLYTSD